MENNSGVERPIARKAAALAICFFICSSSTGLAQLNEKIMPLCQNLYKSRYSKMSENVNLLDSIGSIVPVLLGAESYSTTQNVKNTQILAEKYAQQNDFRQLSPWVNNSSIPKMPFLTSGFSIKIGEYYDCVYNGEPCNNANIVNRRVLMEFMIDITPNKKERAVCIYKWAQ